MASIPYIHKVPVEIWREILRHTIGPSLSNPERDTLRAYDTVFLNYQNLGGLYFMKERTRHGLMLVCRLWSEILEDMDDKIVIGGMDEFDWPPNKRRNEAKSMYYIEIDWDPYDQDLVSTSWMRRRRDAGAIPDSPVWRHESLELVINAKSPPAPVMSVTDIEIKLESGASSTFSGRVRAFQWIIPSQNTDVEILRTPLFDNMTYLSLSTFNHDLPHALVEPEWTFPSLRALVVHFTSTNRDESDAFGRWRCPNLTMLRYATEKSRRHIPSGMLTFIDNHAHKIEELDLWGDNKSHWEVEENWKRLGTLKSYRFYTFKQLVEALPFMRGMWSGIDNASAARRLRIELGWDINIGNDAVSVICAQTAQYKDLLANLDLCVTRSWLNILSNPILLGHYQKRRITDFLAILDELQLNVIDVDGRSSDNPEIQELRQEVERLLRAELNP